MMKHIVAAAVLIGSLTSAEAANSHVIGGWQGLTFSLQDLDPTDAFAPSLTAVQYTNCFGTTSPGCFSIRPPPDFRLPANFEATDSSGFPAIQPLEHTTTTDTLDFELSPNTRLTIAGTIYVDSSGPVYQMESSLPLLDVAVASGKVVARLEDREIAAVSSSVGRDEKSFEISLQSPPQPLLSGVFFSSSFTLEEVLTSGTNIVFPPVPEPATWALMCVGLIGVGWAACRSRSVA